MLGGGGPYFKGQFYNMLSYVIIGKLVWQALMAKLVRLVHTAVLTLSILLFSCTYREIFIAGLFLYALGAGSLRPCITAFGGDQFILPEQEKQLNSFNTYFYIATNAGMLTTGFILPVLR